MQEKYLLTWQPQLETDLEYKQIIIYRTVLMYCVSKIYYIRVRKSSVLPEKG